MEPRLDPYTMKHFIPKRNNQRFENRLNQIRYNNLRALEERNAKREVDILLNRNRRILKKLLGTQLICHARKPQMINLGYSFGVHTHHGQVNNETKKYVDCVYEFAIEPISNDDYKISRYAR